MKLTAVRAEKAAVKTVIQYHGKKAADLLFAQLAEDHFEYSPAKEMFKRARSLLRNRGEMPAWNELVEDPALSEQSRKIMRKFKVKVSAQPKSTKGLFKVLSDHRKARIIVNASMEAARAIKGDSMDVDNVLDKMTDELTKARMSSGITEDCFVHIGAANDNSDIKLLKKILKGETIRYIPTGFATYDSKNAGFPLGGLVTLIGGTGKGKSTVAGQIFMNMSRYGAKCCYVPLEMNKEEMMTRQLSNLSKIKMGRFLRPADMTSAEIKKVVKDYKRYRKIIRGKSGLSTIFVPSEDMSLEEILTVLKPHGYHAIFIDYISLLKGVGGENSWQKLSDVSRFAKRWATNNNTLVVQCAQANKEGEIRYSKGIVEHTLNWNTMVNVNGKLVSLKSLMNVEDPDKYKRVKMKVTLDGINGPRRSTKFMHFGTRKTKKITTVNGYGIESTYKTPVLVFDSHVLEMKWIEARDLKGDELLVMNRGGSWAPEQKHENYRADIAAYLQMKSYKDTGRPRASYRKYNNEFVGLTGMSTLQASRFTHAVKEIYGVDLALHRYEKKGVHMCHVIPDKKLIKKFKKDGLLDIQGVPDFVMNGSRRAAIFYLTSHNLMNATDLTGGKVKIELPTEEHAIHFQILAMKIGTVCKRVKNTIHMTSLDLFTHISQPVDPRKFAFAKQYLENKYRKSVKKVGETRLETNHKGKRVVLRFPIKHPNEMAVKDLLARVKLKFPKEYDKIHEMFRQDIWFEKVKRIKNTECIVRDFEVKKNGNDLYGEGHFTANGFFIHNSNNAWRWDYDREKTGNKMFVKQEKARAQEPFPFVLIEDFSTMTISDIGYDPKADIRYSLYRRMLKDQGKNPEVVLNKIAENENSIDQVEKRVKWDERWSKVASHFTKMMRVKITPEIDEKNAGQMAVVDPKTGSYFIEEAKEAA